MSPKLEITEDKKTLEVKKGTGDATSLQGNKVPQNPSDGDVLRFNGSTGEYEYVGEASLDVDVTDLQGDAIPSGPSDGQLLVYDSGQGQWVHVSESALAVAFSSLTGSIGDGQVPESAVTQHEGAVDHDALTNYAADEHRPLLVDARANRPAAGTADRFFYATDEQALYRDTGSEWQAVEDAFLLDNLDGLRALWRGDTIGGADGDAVSEWEDQSGHGNDLVQTTVASQPTLRTDVLDGHDVVEADGSSNEYLANRDASAGAGGLGALLDAGDAPVTVYAVFRLTSGQQTGNLFSFGNSGSGSNFLRVQLKRTPGFSASEGYGVLRRDDSGTSRANETFATDGKWHALVYRDDGSTSEIWLDGEKVVTETQSLGAMTTDQFALFVLLRGGVAEGMTGQVAEAAVVDRDVTDAELSDIFAGARARFPTLPDDPFQQTAQTLLPNVAATWFNEPAALYDSVGDRTLVGGVTPTGDVRVAAYDHGAGEVVERVLASELEEDDHDNPAFLTLLDDRYLAGYTAHFSGDTKLRETARAGDGRDWGLERAVGNIVSGEVVYTKLVRVPDEGDRIYLFFRSGKDRHFVTSDDDGATWSAPTRLTEAIGGGSANAYMDVAQNGSGRIDVVFVSESPNAVNQNKLSHAYYDAAAGSWKDSAGNALALPISADDATVIYDGTATGHLCWNWDLRIDGNGRPVVVYAEIRSETDHRYRYSRWDGASWTPNVEVATGGRALYSSEPNYSGGIAISDPTTLYVSRESGGEWDLYEYTSSDGGSTWSGSVIPENHGDRDNIRPHVPKDAHADIPVIWYAGLYSRFGGNYRMNLESPLTL